MNLTPDTTVPAQSGFLIELGEILAGQMTLPVDHECSGGSIPLRDSDKFLGTVPPGTTRLLWLAHRYYERLADEQRVAYQHATKDTPAEIQARVRANRYANRSNAYKQVFWATIYDHYFPPSEEYDGISIRQGWAVIATPDRSAAHPALDLLRKLAEAGRLKIDHVDLDDD